MDMGGEWHGSIPTKPPEPAQPVQRAPKRDRSSAAESPLEEPPEANSEITALHDISTARLHSTLVSHAFNLIDRGPDKLQGSNEDHHRRPKTGSLASVRQGGIRGGGNEGLGLRGRGGSANTAPLTSALCNSGLHGEGGTSSNGRPRSGRLGRPPWRGSRGALEGSWKRS